MSAKNCDAECWQTGDCTGHCKAMPGFKEREDFYDRVFEHKTKSAGTVTAACPIRGCVHVAVGWPGATGPWEPKVWHEVDAAEILRWAKHHFGVEGDRFEYYLTVKLSGIAARKVEDREKAGELPLTDGVVDLRLVRAI